jgi:hypothetical protein
MSFCHTLSQHERDLLRKIVKKVHMQHHPKDFQTNYEADKIIDVIGPEIVERMLKFAVDHKVDRI